MGEDRSAEFLGRLEAAGGKASMWKLGEEMGLDRADTENLGVELMGRGLMEMVSLSGSVQITDAGRQAAGGGTAAAGGDDLAGLVAELAAAGDLGLTGVAASDLAVDVATLQAHLGRSRLLPPVFKALKASLDRALEKAPDPAAEGLRSRLAALEG